MAIHESAGDWCDDRPNRCQASLLWLGPRSAIPQPCEALCISPKRARRAKGEIRRNALHYLGLFANPYESYEVISMYGVPCQGSSRWLLICPTT
jgi:hypothetical protein